MPSSYGYLVEAIANLKAAVYAKDVLDSDAKVVYYAADLFEPYAFEKKLKNDLHDEDNNF